MCSEGYSSLCVCAIYLSVCLCSVVHQVGLRSCARYRSILHAKWTYRVRTANSRVISSKKYSPYLVSSVRHLFKHCPIAVCRALHVRAHTTCSRTGTIRIHVCDNQNPLPHIKLLLSMVVGNGRQVYGILKSAFFYCKPHKFVFITAEGFAL